MEDFQRWEDIQGSIDGTMGANRIEKLEEGFRKIESKIKGKRLIEVEEKGFRLQAKP